MLEGFDFRSLNDKNISSVNQKELESLYKRVEEYARINYLKEDDEDEYYIRINGIVYVIGYTYVYDGFYYLVRYEGKIEDIKYFELSDVLNNEISDKQKQIKSKMDIVNNYLNELRKEGVSLRLIKKSIRLK